MTDAKLKAKKFNNANGHVVQIDYIVVCIAFRFPSVRLCPNLVRISLPNSMKRRVSKELEQ